MLSVYTYLLTRTIQTSGQDTRPTTTASDKVTLGVYSSKGQHVADTITPNHHHMQQLKHDLLPMGGDNNNNDNDDDNKKVLAMLYPPGLMGGYRNQVIRFLSFCVYAMKNDVETLFLPSILWSTEYPIEEDDVGNSRNKEPWMPIPHDLLFDVEYWNEQENGLPKLVDDNNKNANTVVSSSSYCWSYPTTTELEHAKKPAKELTMEVLKRGFLTPIANYSRAVATREILINPRKIDKLQEVKDGGCSNNNNNNRDGKSKMKMMVYGGGKAAGRLWNDYTRMHQSNGGIPFQADAKVLQSLRPKREWRDLSMSCVKQHTTGGSAKESAASSYIALHARMELEMMVHACGANMEKNLTKVFGMIQDLAQTELKTKEGDGNAPTGLFIAVDRAKMEVSGGAGYEKYKAYIDENIETLNRAVKGGLMAAAHPDADDGNSPQINVFECGRLTTSQYYQRNPQVIQMGGLLDSVINFYIATEAVAFVGVRGSSYSTDIWTTRFHQGKGHMNFEYTPDGIKRIPNGGLPPPHVNCARPKKN